MRGWCEGVGGLFRIQTDTVGHDRVRALIRTLEGVLRSRLEVRVFALDQSAGTAGGSVARNSSDEATGALGPDAGRSFRGSA